MMPLAIPPMVLALGILWTYVGVRWLPIYGTIGILLLAYVTHYLPIRVRASAGALRQLHRAGGCRASPGAGLLATCGAWGAAAGAPDDGRDLDAALRPCVQEVSSSILLYSNVSTVLSVAVFDLWEAGNVNALAALSVLQLAITFAVLPAGFRLARREVGAWGDSSPSRRWRSAMAARRGRRRLSFSLAGRRACALLGPSGCGKTTTCAPSPGWSAPAPADCDRRAGGQ